MTNELPKLPLYRYGYESASERWLPVRTPESILISVISMLSSPNDESPANLVRFWKKQENHYKKKLPYGLAFEKRIELTLSI